MGEAEPRERVAERTAPVPVPWTSYLPALTALAVLAAAVVLVFFAHRETAPVWQVFALALLAFSCEFVDSSLGMGYGTTLTPLLLLMGYELKVTVPVVLLSEFVTGLMAGGFHHALGNAHFGRRSRDSKVTAVLAGAGLFGALVAVKFLTTVPAFWAKLYFAVMITGMGLLILWRRNDRYRFSWAKVAALGLISSFNKGMSGGGYGPLVVGGQVLSGCDAKNAVGCTSLAESFVCFVALVGFAASGVFPAVALAVPIVLGAVLSAPLAAAMTKFLDRRLDLKRVVGFGVLLLGALCLYKVLG